MNISLRSQLLLWLGLAVLVLIFVVTFLGQEVVVWNMETAIDDTLRERAHLVAAIVSSDITTDEESYASVIEELTRQDLPFIPLLLRVVSPTGRIIIEFGEVAPVIAADLDFLLQSPDVGSGRLHTIRPQELAPLRIYTISVADRRTGEILALVQDAESLEQIDQVKRNLWRNGVIVGIGGSLLAAALGLVLIRRGFRPLRSILQTIDEVDYYHLKTRIQEENRPVELEQLAKGLKAMWQRLDNAVSERQKSLRSISHDLRTPLSTLQGHIEVLLLQPHLSDEVKESLGHMLRETRRLVRLVKNLLLNVQLESQPAITCSDIDLAELVDEVVGDIWTSVGGIQLNVVAPQDVKVFGDRDLLKQMLLDIVDNAIKFTPEGGKIELRLTPETEWVNLEVSDTGQGISRKDLPYVTEAFYKPKKSRGSAASGTGLGLSIVKQIAELHGGKLKILSEEGVGTSVKVRLPRKI